MPRKTFLIIMQGGSAVGKTTLAKKLSKDLGAYLLSKDHFKEMMYDELGIPQSLEESGIYGRSAISAMYAAAEVFLAKGKDIILESVFEKGFAEKDIEAITEGKDITVLQIYMYASPEIRVARTDERARNGKRHIGHPDKVGVMTIDDFAKDTHEYRRLNMDSTIEISTDDFTDTDYVNVRELIKQRLGMGK